MRYRVSFWNPKRSCWIGITTSARGVDDLVELALGQGMKDVRIRPLLGR